MSRCVKQFLSWDQKYYENWCSRGAALTLPPLKSLLCKCYESSVVSSWMSPGSVHNDMSQIFCCKSCLFHYRDINVSADYIIADRQVASVMVMIQQTATYNDLKVQFYLCKFVLYSPRLWDMKCVVHLHFVR